MTVSVSPTILSAKAVGQEVPVVPVVLSPLAQIVQQRIGGIMDPEIDITYSQLRILDVIKEAEPGVFDISYTPSSIYCPFVLRIAQQIKKTALSVNGVKSVKVICNGSVLEDKVNKIINAERPKRGPKPGSKRVAHA